MRNSKLRMTKANTQDRLIDNSQVMDHLLGTLTQDMAQGMVQDMVQGMVADTIIMTTTLNRVGTVLRILQFPSWVRLLVVYC